ncbi:Major_facilitator superfamily protein [Hexamita inflata]|uniref:Major facilitator superfamily protein n=2 Tax=Hexamita inflata TaxID=28002 RepID=A0AA86REQ4_9EUKA|nr:Major facilitator superfamily protein [Hexamita inflata]
MQSNDDSDKLQSENITVQIPKINITVIQKQKKFKALSLMPGQAKFAYMMPLLFLSGITCFMDTQATNMALPYMQKDFDVSESLIQWTLTIYYLAQASLSIPIAKFGENIGQVYTLFGLFVISFLINIGLFFVKNFPAFLVLRFISGAVCGGQLVCRTSLVRKLAPPQKAQQYLQYLQILMSIMVIIVPLLAGVLIDIDWPWIYLVCALSAFLNILTVIPYTNPETPKEKAKFDIWGCVVLFCAIGFLDIAFTILSSYHYVGCGVFVVLSIIMFVVFVYIEKKAADPVLPLQLMKNPVVSYIIANVSYFYIGTGLGYLLPQTFMFYGHPASQTGMITTAAALVMLLVSLFLPKLSKKVLNKHIMVTSFSLNVITIICGIVFSSNVYAFIAIWLVFQTINTFFSQLVFPITLLSVPPQYTSQMSAVPTTSKTLTQGVAMCAVSMIMQVSYNSFKTQENDRNAWSNAIRMNMVVFLVFQVIGLILLIFRTGYAQNESTKKGFKQEKVRQLKIMNTGEENSLLLRENMIEK